MFSLTTPRVPPVPHPSVLSVWGGGGANAELLALGTGGHGLLTSNELIV